MPSGHLVAYTAQIEPATHTRANACMDKARADHAAGIELNWDTRLTQENKQ